MKIDEVEPEVKDWIEENINVLETVMIESNTHIPDNKSGDLKLVADNLVETFYTDAKFIAYQETCTENRFVTVEEVVEHAREVLGISKKEKKIKK